MLKNIPSKMLKPSVLVEGSRFLVKIAETEEEIEKALRLRYEVFNIEQGRGLKCADNKGIDIDEFDEGCLHLLVIDKSLDKAIGTYRLYLGPVARAAQGFYSSREYIISGIERIADKCLELGRSCIAPDFRNGAVIALLWGAISEILIRADLTYMIGCVSLEDTDPVVAWAVYKYLYRPSSAEILEAVPRQEFKLRRPSAEKVEKILSNKRALIKSIPPLLKGYLRLGAIVCGEPAFDTEFGTIDLFMFADTRMVPARYVRHFHYKRKKTR